MTSLAWHQEARGLSSESLLQARLQHLPLDRFPDSLPGPRFNEPREGTLLCDRQFTVLPINRPMAIIACPRQGQLAAEPL